MKQIKKSELKVGDWISTDYIYDIINSKGEISSRGRVANISGNKDGKITAKCWEFYGDIILDCPSISSNVAIFLLDDKEVLEIKKSLILNRLK